MKNIFLPLFILFFIIGCNNSAGVVKPVQDSLQTVILELRNSIKEHPGDSSLKIALVNTLQDAKQYREAVQVLDSMNFSKGDSANMKMYFNYLYKRTELLELAGDTINAIQTLKLFVTPGERTEAGMKLAYLYAETKNPEALVICDAMNKNDASGKDPNPDYLKGIYYYNIEDYDKALGQFNSSISKDYNFLDAHMEKGRILYNQKKFKEAIEVYDMVIKISNTFADAYFWKAKCQEAAGLNAEAKINYQRSYALDKTLKEAKEAANRIIN
jgi:tetratricopeptide (TPR) repeat protein